MRPVLAAIRWPVVCAALLTPAACGPEHGFSGVWRQRCDPEAGDPCAAEEEADLASFPFVYALHIGRYGGDLTGIAVRYENIVNGNPYFSTNECGCYVMFAGSATDSRVRFKLRFVPDGRGAGPGCFETDQDYSATCKAHFQQPPCAEIDFDLSGDEDRLSGDMKCGDEVVRTAVFEPASGKVRRTCREGCSHIPEAEVP